MLVGAGARHARDEVLEVAEILGSPIVKTLSGKAVMPDDHPLTTGGIGLLGTAPSEEAMEKCDTLLMVGHELPVHEVPARSQARPRSSRSRPTPSGPATGSPPMSRWSATPRRRSPPSLPLLDRGPDRALP